MKFVLGAVLTLSIFIDVHAYSKKTQLRWGYLPHFTKISKHRIHKIIKNYDIISHTGTYIDRNGKIRESGRRQSQLIRETVSYSGKISYPIISFNNSKSARRILESSKLRSKTVKSIIDFSKRRRLKGVHLDIERLPVHLNQRITELVAELKKKSRDMVISFALYPQIQKNNRYRNLHNLKELAPHVDIFVIMCYDLHGPGKTAGPVTSIKWSKKNIIYAMKYLDRKKLVLGIPSYGYCFTGNNTKAVSTRYIKSHPRMKQIRHSSGTLLLKNNSSKCYISDKHTRKKMKFLAEQQGLRGWAIWRIDFP